MLDRLSLWITELGSSDIATRQQAAEKLEGQGHAALHPLVDALKHPDITVRNEASRLIVRLVQRPDISASYFAPPEPEPIPETLKEMVSALRSPSVPYREQVEKRLVAQRVIAIPVLIDALPSANPIHASRIAKLLAQLEAVEAIPALITYLNRSFQYPRDSVVDRALLELLELLPENWRALGLKEILPLLENSPYTHLHSEQIDDAIAQTLIRIAREEPVPQLRSALRHLKRPWLKRPFTFEIARRSIEETTRQWKDLPLPAQNLEQRVDLPRPAEQE